MDGDKNKRLYEFRNRLFETVEMALGRNISLLSEDVTEALMVGVLKPHLSERKDSLPLGVGCGFQNSCRRRRGWRCKKLWR